MHEFESQYGLWVYKARWALLLCCVLLVAAMGSGMRHLSFSNDYRVFFSEDNPHLIAFDELEANYAKNDNLVFVIAPKNGDVFTNDTLSAIEILTERAWQVPYSSRVESISNFQHTEAEEDDLVVADLYEDAASLDEAGLLRVKGIATSELVLLNRLISDEGHVAAVSVVLQLPGINPIEETPDVIDAAEEMIDELLLEYPSIDMRMIGMVPMNNAFSTASKNDISTLVPLSFALMLIALWLMVRGFSGTLATMLVILLSIIAALGAGGHYGIPITPPSAITPTVILTVAMANSVHVLVTYYQQLNLGHAQVEAMRESLRVNLQPIFLTSLTTTLGFLSMNFSEVPPFRHLGNMVAVGVAMSFVLSITFLPALVMSFPARARDIRKEGDRSMEWLGNFVVRNRNGLMWGMAGLIAVLVAFVPRNELNDIFVNYFDETVQFRQDADFADANLGGVYTIDYSLDSGEPGGINNPEFLAQLDAFSNWYRSQPEIANVNSISEVMRRLNKNLHGDDEEWFRQPEERDLAAQYLLLYEMSLPYGLDLNNQIDVSKSATRLVVATHKLSTNELLDLDERAIAWLAANAPAIDGGQGTGSGIMFAHIGKRNIVAMLFGTTVAMIGISILLMVAFRSWRFGLISMVPNLVPAAMGFGLWGMLVGEVGLALSVVTTMTLGIVVDDTVHFMSKYLRARRERNMNPEDAVRYAFTSVGRALVVTSIVLVVGFAVLATSHFELNSGMGLLTAIIIVFALVADFFFLPPLLMKYEEYRHEKLATARLADNPAV